MAINNAAGGGTTSIGTSYALTIPSTTAGRTLIAMFSLSNGSDPNLPTTSSGTWAWSMGTGTAGERVYIAHLSNCAAGLTQVNFSYTSDAITAQVWECDDIDLITPIHTTGVLDLYWGPITAGNPITSNSVVAAAPPPETFGVYAALQYTNGTSLFTKGSGTEISTGTGITTGNVTSFIGEVLFAQRQYFTTSGSKSGTCTNAGTVGGNRRFVLFNKATASGSSSKGAMIQHLKNMGVL